MPILGSCAVTSGCTGLGLLWWPGGYNNTGACAVVGLAVCGLGSPGSCPRIQGLLHCDLRFLGGSAVLGGWASSGLLLRPGGPGALGRAWMGLGVALVVGPPRASWPASSDPPSPCSYLTDASPSPPPVRPKNCRTRPSTVTMTVAWRNLRRHPASHPRDPDLVPWLCPRTTMSAPPPMAA